jgi:hypothetical protein
VADCQYYNNRNANPRVCGTAVATPNTQHSRADTYCPRFSTERKHATCPLPHNTHHKKHRLLHTKGRVCACPNTEHCTQQHTACTKTGRFRHYKLTRMFFHHILFLSSLALRLNTPACCCSSSVSVHSKVNIVRFSVDAGCRWTNEPNGANKKDHRSGYHSKSTDRRHGAQQGRICKPVTHRQRCTGSV